MQFQQILPHSSKQCEPKINLQILSYAFGRSIFLFVHLLPCSTGSNPEITILQIHLLPNSPNSLVLLPFILPVSLVPSWRMTSGCAPILGQGDLHKDGLHLNWGVINIMAWCFTGATSGWFKQVIQWAWD